MPTWGMTFSGSDFTSVDVINMLWEAIWERQQAGSFPGTVPSPGTPNTVAAGDDVQTYILWANLQQQAELLFGSTEGGAKWVASGFDLDGKAGTWSFGGDPIGDIDPYPYFDTDGISGVFASLGMSGWMRKRPREISTTTSLFDTQGNPRADGHVARCLADGLVYHFVGGPTYEWQLSDPGSTPDLLVGEVGEERVIDDTTETEDQVGHPAEHGQHARSFADSQVYIYVDGVGWVDDEEDPGALPDRIPTGSGVIFGRVQAGDYLGEWILTELRDVIDATGNRTFGTGLNWADGYGTHAQGGVYDWRIDPGHPTVTTLAIANELTALNWVPGEERHGDPDLDTVTYNVRDKTFIACSILESWWVEVYADRYPSKHSIRTQSHRARSVQIYGIGEKTGTSSGTSVYAFNAFGTGLVENQFKPIGSPQSVSISTTDTGYVTVDPSPTTQPSNPTPPSPPTTEYSEHGVQLTFTCAVVTWTWTWG